jgi:hypothetical protein
MGLWEAILAIYGAAVGTGSSLKDLGDLLRSRVPLEQVLAELVSQAFQPQIPRLQHLCPDGPPYFDSDEFKRRLASQSLSVRSPADLADVIRPHLAASVSTPGATCPQEDLLPVYDSILNSALRGLWKKVSSYDTLARQLSLSHSEALLTDTTTLVTQAESLERRVDSIQSGQERIEAELKALTRFAREAWDRVHDKLLDSAPPAEHRIDADSYLNPFLLVRAEDFNHNYDKLARLFHGSPEWDSIQRRTDNVFIEGGRGTGKSMLLRRLTAQATVAAIRLADVRATFRDAPEDYFGTYVKLTRGYYEQFGTIDTVSSTVSELLAQHELNIEILDAFVDTLHWLRNNSALPLPDHEVANVCRDLSSLCPKAPSVDTLDAFRNSVVRFEQDQIITYYRERAFNHEVRYSGSALDTVTFLRRLSEIFRSRLFPRREMRLFLLIDEFETLLEVQQKALNTVMKMRLPDLSLKITVRKSGRKTSDTFTPGDPIQQPRDYTEVTLDYDITSQAYASLLRGIAERRLLEARYPTVDIRAYLPGQTATHEVSSEELESELRLMWESGSRRHEAMTDDFRQSYSTAAVYRLTSRTGRRKAVCGFEQYALLSSGIVSNFIELCKYAFYFALSDEIPLRQSPAIPSYLQTDAAYGVSQRLLATIDGNVPLVGEVLARLVLDLGLILRNRLLRHPSEPEANRLAVEDYGELGNPRYGQLRDVLNGGLIWSVLHVESPGESFRPKNESRASSVDLIVNRIYCPALGISPRARWRVPVRVSDLARLIEPSSRRSAFLKLSRAIGLADGSLDAEAQSQLGLFQS